MAIVFPKGWIAIIMKYHILLYPLAFILGGGGGMLADMKREVAQGLIAPTP